MRSRPLASRAALALLLCGCSVFNRPDPGHLDAAVPDMGPLDGGPPDMGMDPDMGPPDMGLDAPDAWSCPGGDTETACGDGADNDCDGLVDCGDPDCVRMGATECCAAGTSVFSESFNSTTLSMTRWAGTVTNGALDGMRLGTFPPPPMIEAMVAQGPTGPLCLQPELGLRIQATFVFATCTDCSGSVDLVVGPTTRVVTGGTLQEDLAIRGTNEADGLHLRVFSGPDERGHTTMALGSAAATVTIDLSPTVVDGVSYIGAHVAVSGMSGPETLVDNLPIVQRDRLQRDSCGDNARGMFLGVQGSGTGVRIDQIDVTQSDCPGPTSFAPSGTGALTQVTFGADGVAPGTGWASGGVGDPSLSRVRQDTTMGTPYEWLVLYDASSTFRSSEPFASLPLSLGGGSRRGASTLPPDASSWIPRRGMSAGASGTPYSRGTPDRPMRDPTVGIGPNGLLMNSPVMWAERVGPGDTYQLMRGTLPYSTSSDIDPMDRTAVAIGNETCASLRSPLLLPRLGDTDGGWVLFYVCADGRGEVHVATATAAFTTIERIPGVVLGRDELGASASLGVIDVAGAGWMYGSTPLYRLWMVTRAATGASVAFAEGTVSPSMASASFTPFPGNPVLTADDPAFGRCALQCEIHGISATRWPDGGARNLVQLLVERWETTATTTTYGLVPLAQRYPPGM
jgi:hypothetical protein